MANGKLAFRAGMMVGAAAGALWVVAGRRWLDSEYELLDWNRVEEIAIRTSGKPPLGTPWSSLRLRSSYEKMVRELEAPISEYTRTSLPSSEISVSVMGRKEWIEANVTGFRYLFEPVEEMYRELGRQTTVVVPGLAKLSQMAVSSQIGLLLGYLSRRVLGQYDMSVLGREPLQGSSGGRLYFVQQNIEGVEAQLGLPAEEFRSWIVLHESTHAHEFEVFPWLRDYMNHILRAYLDCVLHEVRGASGGSAAGPMIVARMIDNLRSGRSILESIMSPRQQRYMRQLQALMCLLEGYSNHVMNEVGKRIMPHYDGIKRRVESRSKEKSPAEQLFLKLTGLSMKMDQYRLGEVFVDRVVAARGIEFANRAYEGPENLPTMEEVLHPERWIARMESVV
ncbi:MAG: zinc-dependent metalloprotease [Sphingomonadaceae bacterium]